MEDVEVVDCEVEQEGPEVHGGDRLPEVLADDFAELADEWVGGWMGLGGQVDEGVVLDEVVEEALPILEHRYPLIELNRANVPYVL